MRYVILTFAVLVGMVLNRSIAGDLGFLHMPPDYLLIVVVFYATYNGHQKGAIMGMAAGLAEDLTVGAFIGMNAISKGVAGYAVGKIKGDFYKDNVLFGMLSTAIGSVANAFTVLFINILNAHLHVTANLITGLLLQIAATVLVAIPAYFILVRLRRITWIRQIWESI